MIKSLFEPAIWKGMDNKYPGVKKKISKVAKKDTSVIAS
jgi:hypothetical protein